MRPFRSPSPDNCKKQEDQDGSDQTDSNHQNDGDGGLQAGEGEQGQCRSRRRKPRDVRGEPEGQPVQDLEPPTSGSYFPPAAMGVPIPKVGGKVRVLGVPTVADRVAQMVVKQILEPRLEAVFHPSSFGYRPRKGGAKDALEQS